MEKASVEMNMEEWELLLDDGGNSKGAVDIDYLIFPSHSSDQLLLESMEDSSVQVKVPSPITTTDPLVEMESEPEEELMVEKEEIMDITASKQDMVTPQEEEKSPEVVVVEEEEEEKERKEKGCWEELGFGIWRWRLTGIGRVCSVAMAAATICILLLGGGGNHHQKQQQLNQTQRLQFQICTDDSKRLKQVVQSATRLNQTISAVRGVPMTGANISFGGYYDGI